MICLIKVENPDFLTLINKKSYHQRPGYRRLECELDTSISEIFILPDLFSESISCEIKVN